MVRTLNAAVYVTWTTGNVTQVTKVYLNAKQFSEANFHEKNKELMFWPKVQR